MIKGISLPSEGVLFIDPGLSGSGWAFYPKLNSKAQLPCNYGCIYPRTNDVPLFMWGKMVDLFKILEPQKVVIEWPSLWGANSVSYTAAVKGDLFKLTYLIGGYARDVVAITKQTPLLVTPSDWKGQMPKDVMLFRIQKKFPELAAVKSHAADAVGMGLAAQGVL